MGLFSKLQKNKQEPVSDESEYSSRAEEESKAIRGRGKRKKAQETDSDDLVLPEKKRARRRLVGALALVLAVVIGLPMILDSEPKPLADDIAIQIPSKDKPTAQGAHQPAAWPAATAAPEQSDTAAAAPAAVESPAPAKEPEASSQAVAPTPAAVATVDATAQKPEKLEKPETPSSGKTIAKSPPKADETARAMAILEGKSGEDAKPAPDKKSGKYSVQVAALSSKEKIVELQGKLKAAGLQSYTQNVATASGARTRIRVGPLASKEEAEKVRAKLVKAGLNGTVIPPAP